MDINQQQNLTFCNFWDGNTSNKLVIRNMQLWWVCLWNMLAKYAGQLHILFVMTV